MISPNPMGVETIMGFNNESETGHKIFKVAWQNTHTHKIMSLQNKMHTTSSIQQ
jgi:hypothetical protein